MADDRLVKIKALTPIWTGDASQQRDRLITTGLLGSIRWWFEVLVRGLGGSACDPSFEDRKKQPRSSRCPDPTVKEPAASGHHCVVCELFGCTSWARKFRFQVVDGSGNAVKDAIKKEQEFILRFTALRLIKPEEWALLDVTLRLIADYGAIGGRTVLKPSDESGRQDAPNHKDHGLIEIVERLSLAQQVSEAQLRAYVKAAHWRRVEHDKFAWASIDHFWCVRGRYLARQDGTRSTFNRVIGRPEPKAQATQNDSWMAGRRPDRQQGIEPESKKVFSFKEPARTFGFVPNSHDINNMASSVKSQLAREWQGFQSSEFNNGDQILCTIFT